MDWESETYNHDDPRHLNTGFAIDTMHLACKGGNLEILMSIIDDASQINRLGVNWRNRRGATALMTASQYGHLECVLWLIGRKAKVDVKRVKDGSTPIVIAAKNGQLACVKALLETDSWPKKLRRKEFEAEMFKVIKEALERNPFRFRIKVPDDCLRIISEFAISLGADLTITNDEGHNAIEMAARYGHVNVTQYLSQFYLPKGPAKAMPRSSDPMNDTGQSDRKVGGILTQSRTDTPNVRNQSRKFSFSSLCNIM
jgi:ankyrin repeat protein